MAETAGDSKNPTPASSRHPQSDRNVLIPASSLSLKSVLLHDWWLVKNQSKQISVAGFASRERLGARVFYSAPISRRIDTTTLETIDGIIVTISGFINRSQMLQNGFPFLVCNLFHLGFPYDWEECITQCNDEESAKRCVSTKKSSNSSFSSGTKANSSLPLSFDNLPATRIHDLVLHMSECSENSVYDHIMGKVASNAFQHSQEPAKFEADETTRSRKRAKADQVYNNDDATIFDAKDMETEVLTQSRGVLTRSRRITQCNDEVSAKRGVSTEKSSYSSFSSGTKANSSLPLSFDNLPATRIHDFVLHMSECSETSVCDHIMGKVANNAFQHSQEPAKFEVDKTTRSRKRARADQMYNNDDDDATVLDAKDMETEVLTQSRGVLTRSRDSSKNPGSKEENLTPKLSVNSKHLRNKPVKEIAGDSSSELSTPAADKNISAEVVRAMKSSTKQDKKLAEASDISSVRRSGRLKIQKSYLGMVD
ncbi:kinetochore-associated protein KNL-2 homolog [Euphorbia lathyris]|uniref:kinetochore-associated protein KNL-2 homolog n=1 Tax=Euphorbia lathyris TaxID=212925 RepID=UPI003313D80E